MALNRKLLITSAVTSSLMFIGCTEKKETRIVEAKQAPTEMSMNFTKATTCQQASCITIQKSSLGKIFLLIASGTTGGSTPQWYDLKPQVVSFERSGQRIALIGQNYNSIYEEIQNENLIQTFKVVSEDDKSITFDWGGGLRSFISQNSYDVDSPRGMNNDLTESAYTSIPVVDSFIRKIKFDDKNIELEQVSKVPSTNIKAGDTSGSLSLERREETLVMNIQIRSYNLDPAFKPKAYDSSRRVGFFVTKISKKNYSKDVTNLISKWDLSPSRGPVRIRISATVPEDYVQAVTEGALYWNKVFGRNVVQVETGVKPEDASPQDRSIMIRWIDWLDAGAAYAISQSDPLTGEILRAQVFMPSVFTKVGSADLVTLNGNAPVVVNGAVACDFTPAIKELVKVAREATDSQRLRLAQDSVRSTVAHELGHAFGLRHNFAGSFSSKVSVRDIEAATKVYLQDKNHQGLETSTSIMDYVGGLDNILMAARTKYAALSYDKMAMDWAYSDNDSALDESISKYCTDEDIALANSQGLNAYGCERFDAGNNPLERKFLDAKDEKANLVNVLFASIIGRLYPGDQPGVVNKLEQVLKDTVKWGKADMSPLSFVGQALFDLKKDGTPAGSFASLEYLKTGKVLYSKVGLDMPFIEARKKDLAAIGGYAGILNDLLRNPQGGIDTDWFDRQISALEASGYLAKGKTLSGRDYSLTTEQQAKILAFFRSQSAANKKVLFEGVKALLPKLNETVADSDGKAYTATAVLPTSLLDADQAASVSQLALDLLTVSSDQSPLIVLNKEGASLSLPVKFLTSDERVGMLKMLSTQGLSFAMELNRARVKNALVGTVNGLLKHVSDLDYSLLSEDQKKTLSSDLLASGAIGTAAKGWLDSELLVLKALDSVK